MTGQLDHARAKRLARARRTGTEPAAPPRPWAALGWRTEYPEEFPVIVTKIEPKEKPA